MSTVIPLPVLRKLSDKHPGIRIGRLVRFLEDKERQDQIKVQLRLHIALRAVEAGVSAAIDEAFTEQRSAS